MRQRVCGPPRAAAHLTKKRSSAEEEEEEASGKQELKKSLVSLPHLREREREGGRERERESSILLCFAPPRSVGFFPLLHFVRFPFPSSSFSE